MADAYEVAVQQQQAQSVLLLSMGVTKRVKSHLQVDRPSQKANIIQSDETGLQDV